MAAVNAAIIYGFFAVRLDAFDRGDKSLAVGSALITVKFAREPLALVGVGEANQLRELKQVVIGDHELMVGAALIVGIVAVSIGQAAYTGQPPILVDGGGNAQAQQHALCGLEERQVRLSQPHTDALGLSANHCAVGIEQPLQETAMEGAGGLLDEGCNRLHAAIDTVVGGQVTQPDRANNAAVVFGLIESVQIGAGLKVMPDGIDGLIGHLRAIFTPKDQFGGFLIKGAVTDQRAQQPALIKSAVTRPLRIALAVKLDPVTRLELAGFDPVELLDLARKIGDREHLVVGGQSQGVTFVRFQAEDRLDASFPKAGGGLRLTVNERVVRPVNQVENLPRPLCGQHPGVAGDAGVSAEFRQLAALGLGGDGRLAVEDAGRGAADLHQ